MAYGWIEPLVLGGGVAAVACGGLAYVTFAPACPLWGPQVIHGSREPPPRVTLTFDDGPFPGATDQVLDILGALNVKATFFVIGRRVAEHPQLVRRMHAEGHLLANHSFDHWGWAFVRGARYWQDQLARTDAAIQQAAGVRPRLFRPPLGMKTPLINRAAAPGHLIVGWTRRGFDGIHTTPARIIERLVPRSRAGDILLLHDGVSPQSRRDPAVTVQALRPVIEGLRARDLQLVRLDELTEVHAYMP